MKHNLLKALTFLIVLTLVLQACKKGGPDEPTDPSQASFDIYAAGREGYVAKYWKNGNAVILGTGSGASDANAMAISGGDVHVVGSEINPAGIYVAKYWKNGVAISLTDGSRNAFANDVFIQGNDVYIAGQELAPGKTTYQAKY